MKLLLALASWQAVAVSTLVAAALSQPVSAVPHLSTSDPAVALFVGAAAGFAFGLLIYAIAVWWARRRTRGSITFLAMPADGTPDRPTPFADRVDTRRALGVLQAEHDRLRSELAQRAQQISRLEAELRSAEIKSSRTIQELLARNENERAAHDAALAEAARLKLELIHAQSIAAQVPGLEDRLARIAAETTSCPQR